MSAAPEAAGTPGRRPPPMAEPGARFRELAARLGFDPPAVALVFAVAPRTASRWFAGKMPVPALVMAALEAIEAVRLAKPHPQHPPPPGPASGAAPAARADRP